MASQLQQEEQWMPKIREDQDRIGFIRKVYAILCMQLSLTTLIAGLVVAIEALQEWLFINWPFLLVCVLINIIVLITLLCFKNTARKHPNNIILLGIFTITESLLVGNFAAFYDPMTVLIAAILTLGVTIGVTAYACLTKTDFTTFRGILFGLILGFLLYAIFLGVFFDTLLFQLGMCLIFIIIYTIFIVIDTKMIVGGNRWGLSYDDYIIGSLCLYIDIIGLFMYLLRFLGRK